MPGDTPETWEANALFAKAQRYVEHMAEEDSKSWEHALWSSLSLEFLARAALSNVSPALLADCSQNNWHSLFHSLGFTPKEAKFSPKSVGMTDVVKRLREVIPDFDKEIESFCLIHIGKRKGELHSGETPFDGVPGSNWHPGFYKASKVLLSSMGISLEDFVGADEAATAEKLISAAADEKAKAVQGDVEAHKKVWLAKGADERQKLAQAAVAWATRQAGHRVNCPACASQSLVVGEPISAPNQKLENDTIIETQDYLPSQFECIACGLKILGLSRLNAVDLGDRYTKTQSYDAAEYYAPEDEFYGFEDDNNERF
jgi:hypothetical protein